MHPHYCHAAHQTSGSGNIANPYTQANRERTLTPSHPPQLGSPHRTHLSNSAAQCSSDGGGDDDDAVVRIIGGARSRVCVCECARMHIRVVMCAILMERICMTSQ